MIVKSTQSTTLITTAYRRKYWPFLTMRPIAILPFWPKTKSSCAIKSSMCPQLEKLQKYLLQLYLHNVEFTCKTPCSANKFNTHDVHTTETSEKYNLVIVFGKKLDVVHSTFRIDEQTFLTRLGGSVSSGRTLLWILISLLGAFQVIFKNFN